MASRNNFNRFDLKQSPEQNSGDELECTLQEHIIVLLQSLQTSLNISEIMTIFAASLKRFVEFESFSYHHELTNTFYAEGQINHQQAHYKLTIDDKAIGEITLTREQKFLESDLVTLEFFLSLVINVIKNSLQYQEIKNHAYKDSLTDIGNRFAMEQALNREIEFSRRHQSPLTLIMLDLDNFKQLNDEFGHIQGDEIIKKAAQTIADTVRESDVLFRYGGDEFIIILRQTDVSGATQLAERIRKDLQHNLKKMIETLPKENRNLSATTSIGVAPLLNADDATQLLERADKALYAAKKLGRNKVQS